MSDFKDPHFIKALCCEPEKRTLQELQIIYYGLHALEPLSNYRDSILRALCKLVRYEKHKVNEVLFCTGELVQCWYILLSGAVFIGGSMFLPGSSFGKRNGGSVRRPSECFVLEASEMIVIDYPEATQNLNSVNSLLYQIPPPLGSGGGGGESFSCDVGLSGNLVQNAVTSCSNSTTSSLYSNSGNSGTLGYHYTSAGTGHNNNNNNINCNTPTSLAISTPQIVVNYRQQLATSGGCGTTATSTIMDHHHLRHTAGFPGNRPELYQKCNRGSHSSDTSSAYSGSDTMTSVHSSSLDADEVDLSGLVESVVDSDEEDLAESMDSLNVRDAVRDCLEKDPSDRAEDDIETLLDFTQTLKAFTNMTLPVRRALCSVMVFAVVDKAGTMVMSDGEELDSWSVLINGHVEIEHCNGDKEELQVGDSFGILPTMDKLYHRGIMRTKCDDCQFVCITQNDYYRIQHQGEDNIKKHEEDGHIVMVTELRQNGSDAGTTPRRGYVVIRGTNDRLMLQLIEENSMTDPTYVEDFLLTYRTFINDPQKITKQLLKWFNNENILPYQTNLTSSEIRDRVTRVVLLWVNNHFTDFETDSEMMEFLEIFENGLESKNMSGQLNLLHIACAAKARIRNVTLTRSSRDENLNFSIIGGYENGGYGIFITLVDKNTKPDDVGLKRGDQILEVNGQSFEHVTLNRAMEILMSTTHLSITVKSNLLTFKEMLKQPDNTSSPRPRNHHRRHICTNDINKLQVSTSIDSKTTSRLSSVDLIPSDQVDNCNITTTKALDILSMLTGTNKKDTYLNNTSSSTNSTSSSSHKSGFMTLGPKRRIQKALIKMNLLPKNIVIDSHNDDDILTNSSISSSSSATVTTATIVQQHQQLSGSCNNNNIISNNINHSHQQLYHSRSNPDLSNIYYDDNRTSDYPEHVLKVYKSDQTCKYLLINKETTAHEVVMLALQEFGIHETSSNFSLCEVTVGDGGMIKQRRLPEQLQNLAERIDLCSRYYLKTNGVTETLVPDDMAPELIRESTVNFLQLNANELSIQLTFQDFAIFRQIESTEYVDDLFELKSKYGIPMLKKFSELVNREMFWVVTEVCSEHNMVRRMKIVKQFIKIARHCKECRNFNSMFAIISGLGHAAVSRLRQTWEKLPTKYQKLFTDLQDLMDPSRNMSKYRQLVSAELLVQHPIIPFYPVVKKDLTFIHLGNDTYVEGLINFEKLRMIAKEVRILTHMCSTTYDLLTMLEFKGQAPSSAMVALNQMSVSSGSHNLYGQATVKRRKKSTVAPNPKKMFEEAQMVRRVKAYLNNMKVITDEDALHTLSLECEPSLGGSGGNSGGGGNNSGNGSGSGSAPSSVTIRKRHPSPTLSTTSSTSSTSEGKKSGISGGPKFGTASPQAVKKILSLSEQTKTRPHQPRHPGIGLPLVAHTHGLHHTLNHPTISPSPSPGAHRRMGSSSSAGSTGRVIAIHERSHSDTPTPLPSVDLSVESSSVTSLSNLPLRKTITSGSVTSSDSGNGSCIQADTNSNCSESSSGLYHVASSIVHNTPSPTLQQRRHSAIHVPMQSPNSTSHHIIHQQGDGLQTSSTLSNLNNINLSTSQKMLATLIQPTIHNKLNFNTGAGGNISCTLNNNCGVGNSNLVINTMQRLNPVNNLPSATTIIQYPHNLQTNHLTTAQNSHAQLPQHSGNLYLQQGNVSYHIQRSTGHVLMAPPPPKGPRHPPSYSVAAQMARLQRIGRAHSHEGVITSSQSSGTNIQTSGVCSYYRPEPGEDDDEDAQVSAV